MATASWTYELPAAGEDSAGLEEYAVEDSSGRPAGKVLTVLDRGGQRYLAVERGTPPLHHDRRAIPWENVAEVDHHRLAVRLNLDERAIEDSLELDPSLGTEDGEAEAVRVTELPRELRPFSRPDEPGPADRATYAPTLGLGLLGVLTLLGLVALASEIDFTWEFALFAIPLALLLLSLVSAYRLFRRPYT